MTGKRTRIAISLTLTEWAVLCEAVRYSQEAHVENDERMRLHPVLSRIQRKLGVEVGDE